MSNLRATYPRRLATKLSSQFKVLPRHILMAKSYSTVGVPLNTYLISLDRSDGSVPTHHAVLTYIYVCTCLLYPSPLGISSGTTRVVSSG